MLYVVSIPDGKATVVDSLDVLMDYDFSWSPDGHWLAFTRPTALDSSGEYPLAADLWIADVETGNSWPLLEGQNWVESNPLWISPRSIQVNRSARKGDELGTDQVVVVEIGYAKEKSLPHSD
jgi:Tol biopolymer transport system component